MPIIFPDNSGRLHSIVANAAFEATEMTMDPVNLTYYAVVCGGLAAYAPSVSSRISRVVVGLATGGVSAALLPVVHRLLGF